MNVIWGPGGGGPVVPVMLEDLSGRQLEVKAPVAVTSITVDVGRVGSLLFLKTTDVTATGRPIYRQIDHRPKALTIQ